MGNRRGKPDETVTCPGMADTDIRKWTVIKKPLGKRGFSERVDAFLVKSAFLNLWLFINVSMIVIVRNLTLQINNKK